MLTEIEWWGGLLIIWMVSTFMLIYQEYRDEPKFDVSFISTCFSVSAAIMALSLYFYPLSEKTVQTFYLIVLVIGSITTAMMFFWPESESMKAKAKETESSEEEEDIGKAYEILGQAILFFPVILSYGLGIYKYILLSSAG